MNTYFEPEKNLPVSDKVDVLVAGGGVAGFSSAVSAARNGAKTMLVERGGIIGGVVSSTLQVSWEVKEHFWDLKGEQVVTGIPWELHRRIIENGGGVLSALKRDTAPTKMVFDREVFIKVALEMIEEAGVKILFHTQACDVIKEGNAVKGVILENKSGRQAALAKQVIDATGDADVCFWAGAECTPVSVDNSMLFRVGGVDLKKTYEAIKLHKEYVVDKLFGFYNWELFQHDWEAGIFRGYSLTYRDLVVLEAFRNVFREAISEGWVSEDSLNWMRYPEARKDLNGLNWGFDMQGIEGRVDTGIVNVYGACGSFMGIDAEETSKHKMVGYKQTWIFFENIIKKMPGFEKSFIIDIATDYGIRKGRHVKTDYSVTAEDIAEGRKFDDAIGRYAMRDVEIKYLLKTFLKRQWNEKQANPQKGFDIPYRQILPTGLDNIFVVGKPITILRYMPTCMLMGEAAGTAAALASERDSSTREIDIRELQKRLRNQGVNLG